MTKYALERERLSIDVLPEEHRRIKAYAALYGESLREYVLKSIRERLLRETEIKELFSLTAHLDKDPILKKLWENKKDSGYDKL
ncbi:MAG TPA: hypothetical protein VI976_01810 [Candidatus Omnitrophota bacterium]|nr:hypothetical protein [Candidatus Omnitrophota bacterium]